MPLAEVLEVTLRVAGILEALCVRYLVGGSVASSLHGIPRATQDVDLVAELRPAHVEELMAMLEEDFYVSRGALDDAVARRSCFNIIEHRSGYKIDIFVLGSDALAEHEMARRQTVSLGQPGGGRELAVATAEDIVLQKLVWFRLGQGVSDRQWQDVQGVLRVQGERLDREYLHERAAESGLTELLARALQEAGLRGAGAGD